MLGTGGLKTLTTEQLRRLLKGVHDGVLPCPIDRVGLTTIGLQHIGDDIAVLKGVDAAGVRAVLVCVLAERTR
jgi:hypothetical protein